MVMVKMVMLMVDEVTGDGDDSKLPVMATTVGCR